MTFRITLGTRGSKLALWQATSVQKALQEHYPSAEILVRTITTKGDKILDTPPAPIGGKGLFVKELEEALNRGEIDVAVHSVKDVPTELTDDLTLIAYLPRANPQDVLVSQPSATLHDLPRGALVGTASLRRACQLKALRPDLRVVPIRGNLDTRLKKLEANQYNAIIVAAAGMIRLGLEPKISSYLPLSDFIPAVGQGCIGLEARKDRADLNKYFAQLDDRQARTALSAERSFLAGVEGGCQIPVGAYAQLNSNSLSIRAFICNLDGTNMVKDTLIGPAEKATQLGHQLAQKLLKAGGETILRDLLKSSLTWEKSGP